jgi:hypothetical protein
VSIIKEKKNIEAVLDTYRSKLDSIPDNVFDAAPPGGGWSYAEVYSHIMQATLMSHIALDRCTSGTSKPTKDGLTFLGRLVFFMGRFPPVKIKVPQSVDAKMPAQKISKEEAKNLIIKCRKRLEEAASLIASSLPKNRSKHPRMGMLNAGEWLKFIRIHLQHHVKQLNRIEKKFQQH